MTVKGLMTRPFCIMLLYWYLLHYGLLLHIMVQYLCIFSLILQGLHKEGECRQLEFWTGKEQIWETYSAQLQTSWKFMENYFGIYKKYWAKKAREGGHLPSIRAEGAPYPPGHAPYLVGPLVALRWPSSAIWSLSMEKSNKPSSRTKLHRHEAEPI